MQYVIGEVYDFAGQARKVLGFDAAGLPVTTQDLEAAAAVSAASGFDEAALRVQMEEAFALQLAQELEAQRALQQGNVRELCSLLPLDKLTLEQLTKLASHLELAPTKGADKSALIAMISSK